MVQDPLIPRETRECSEQGRSPPCLKRLAPRCLSDRPEKREDCGPNRWGVRVAASDRPQLQALDTWHDRKQTALSILAVPLRRVRRCQPRSVHRRRREPGTLHLRANHKNAWKGGSLRPQAVRRGPLCILLVRRAIADVA